MREDFLPQLCADINKVKEPLRFPLLMSTKLDGIRGVGFADSIRSRSLKLLPNKALQQAFQGLRYFDGEFIVGDPAAPNVYNLTDSFVMSINRDDILDQLKFYAFDYVENPEQPFETRLQQLATAHAQLPENLRSCVVVLTQTLVNSQAELDQLYERALELGYEGLIGRNPRSVYKFGRCTPKSQDALKVKPFADDEAVVLEVLEAMHNLNEAQTNELGRTFRSSHQDNKVGAGMAGGFRVRDVKTGIEFNISAGALTHAERVEVWQNRTQYVNRLLTYRHMPHGVKEKARHGRFLRWRSSIDT